MKRLQVKTQGKKKSRVRPREQFRTKEGRQKIAQGPKKYLWRDAHMHWKAHSCNSGANAVSCQRN